MKYSNRKKEFVKLTIRVESKELDEFKAICGIKGLSANNQINIMIREFLFENKRFVDKKNCQNEQCEIDFWGENVTPKN